MGWRNNKTILFMKRDCILFFVVAVIMTLNSCKDVLKSYTITGTAVQAEDSTMVLLEKYIKPDWVVIDTAYVKDSVFSFEGQTEVGYMAYVVYEDEKIPVIVEPGRINVDCTLKRASGTDCNKELSKYLNVIDPIDKATDSLYVELGKVNSVNLVETKVRGKSSKKVVDHHKSVEQRKSEINAEIAKLDSVWLKNTIDVIEKNIENPLGISLFARYNSVMADDVDLLVKLTKKIPEQYRSLPEVANAFDNIYVITMTSVGSQFTEFSFTTNDGKTTDLTKLVNDNTFVMIDFWASWCPSCRAQMSDVKALYEKYGDKGLCIVGVSLDSDRKAWENAINKYGMDWIQTSDLKGWDSEFAATYGVKAIPSIVLIDSLGTIVSRELSIDKIEDKLAEEIK